MLVSKLEMVQNRNSLYYCCSQDHINWGPDQNHSEWYMCLFVAFFKQAFFGLVFTPLDACLSHKICHHCGKLFLNHYKIWLQEYGQIKSSCGLGQFWFKILWSLRFKILWSLHPKTNKNKSKSKIWVQEETFNKS